MAEIKFASSAIQHVMEISSDDSPLKKIDEKCSDFLEMLDSLPKSVRHETMPTKEWNLLWFRDHTQAQLQLNKEINEEINFIWTITSFKVYRLFREIVRLLDEGKLYESTGPLRMLTEINCLFAFTLHKIQPIVEQMNKHTQNYDEWDKLHLELERVTLKQTRGSKLKSLVEVGTDVVKADSIMNAIDFVSKKEHYKDVRARYDVLCECVHPNLPANSFFGVITKTYQEEPVAALKKEKIFVFSAETEIYVRDLPPQTNHMQIGLLGANLHTLTTNMDLFTESLDGYRKLKVELMTASKPEKLPDELQKIIDELKNCSPNPK